MNHTPQASNQRAAGDGLYTQTSLNGFGGHCAINVALVAQNKQGDALKRRLQQKGSEVALGALMLGQWRPWP
jgi:hypothetical protein